MPPRVLLIEPSPDLCRRFTLALERCGFEVRAAGSADEVLAAGDGFAPDIVIADYHLGDESASELMRALRENHPGITVLLTSDAFATEQTFGFVKLLPKPSEPRALLDLLRRKVSADSLWHVRRGRAAS